MKEEKVGKKPKGMVVVISVGKPGGKKPEREADPDTKKKASIEELQQEAESLRGARDFPTARRFQSTANMLGQETPGREVAVQAAQVLSPGDEQMPTALYEEGLQSPDFMDMRQNPEQYDPVHRENFMRLMRQMDKHRRQVAQGQESLAELRRDDPSKFFSDRMTGRVQTGEAMDLSWRLLKAAGRIDPSSPSRTQHKYSDRRGPIGLSQPFMNTVSSFLPASQQDFSTGPSNLTPLRLDRGVTEAGEQLPPETIPMSPAMTPLSEVEPPVNYASLPDEVWASGGIQPTEVKNPIPMYSRMNIEGEIPFEDPHMELRLDHEERELDRLQGLQGDSPNIRPRLHALHGSKPGRLVSVRDPRFADEPILIPAFRHRELYSWSSPPDPNNEIIIHEGRRYEKIPYGMRRNPNYGRYIRRPRKNTVQQRRGEGIIQRSEDDDALSDILKGDLSNVDFCDCCSPSELAWAVMKAKKKSKPFHGYNPKRHHRKGGLSAKGRAKFKRETGANLKPPVTTKPSKLKPGSKKAKRRKSFCARMSGTKGPTSKKGKLTPKGAALKRWNC